jgi:hypothetical protein
MYGTGDHERSRPRMNVLSEILTTGAQGGQAAVDRVRAAGVDVIGPMLLLLLATDAEAIDRFTIRSRFPDAPAISAVLPRSSDAKQAGKRCTGNPSASPASRAPM